MYLRRRDLNNHLFVKEYISLIKDDFYEISTIEIETISGCNGTCKFCPINKQINHSHPQRMDETLFRNFINELKKMPATRKH